MMEKVTIWILRRAARRHMRVRNNLLWMRDRIEYSYEYPISESRLNKEREKLRSDAAAHMRAVYRIYTMIRVYETKI